MSQESEELQVEDAKKFLDSNFRSDIMTFAYPYTEVSPGLLFWVKKYDFAARGGRGDSSLLYIKSDVQPDWFNLGQPLRPGSIHIGIDDRHTAALACRPLLLRRER